MKKTLTLGMIALCATLAACDKETDKDTTKPTVALTAPASVKADETVKVTADAKDNVAVKEVQFYLDEKLVSTDNTAPYEADVKFAAGKTEYTVKAIAVDSSNNQSDPATQKVAVTAVVTDTVAPTLTLTPPADVTAAGKVKVKVEANDNVGVTKLTGTATWTGLAKPIDLTIDPAKATQDVDVDLSAVTKANNGDVTINVTAEDTAGNKTPKQATFKIAIP